MDVGAMDKMIYESLRRYFHTLELKGYMSYPNVEKLLILIFFKDFMSHDYKGILTYEDYHIIEKALNCLYGTTCLIPYPDYVKMGKLHLGEITELADRVKYLEDTNFAGATKEVVKVIHDSDEAASDDSDISIDID